MVMVCLVLLVALCRAAFYPHSWALLWPFAQLMAVKAGFSRPRSLVVAANGGVAHIFDIISNCVTREGHQVDPVECAQSVTASVFALSLSVLAYHATGTWTKRDVVPVDALLSKIPATISDVKVHGEPVTGLTSVNIRKRQSVTEDPIDVYYNGTLPLTFIIHHEVPHLNTTIPIFHATDGNRAQIAHIRPVNSTWTVQTQRVQWLQSRRCW